MNIKVTLLSLILILLSAVQVLGKETETLSNEFIKIIVNKGPQDQGRFSIETTGGDPLRETDNDQLLIYGRPTPWSSYTTLRINDTDYIFGGPSKKTQRRTGKKVSYGEVISQTKTEESIITKVKFDSIFVTQKLRFFRNSTTRVKDAVLISYTIENTSKKPQDVGLRLMLDTKLGSNDGAPFRIGESEVTSELQLNKNKLSDYWMTFDSLSTPNVIAQGTLKLGDLQIYPPDKLLLSNWGTLVDNPWDITYEEGRSFIRTGEEEKDTALGLYWNKKTILPSENIQIQTLYGLGEITLSPGELSLGLTAPKEMPINSTEEHLIMAYIYNSGGFDAHNSNLEFHLPKGLSITKGKLSSNYPLLKTGETIQIPIKVKINGAIKPGNYNIGFRAQSKTLEANSISRQITFSAPPKLSYKIATQPIKKSPKENYYMTTLWLNNYSHLPIKNTSATIKLPSKLSLVNFEEQKKTVPLLTPNSKEKLTWLIKTPVEEIPTNSIRVLVRSNTNRTLLSRIAQHVPNETLSISESKSNIKKDDYFYISIDQTQANTIPGELSFNVDEKLQFIRYSISPDIATTINVSQQKNQIIISKIKTQALPFSSSLVKLHFKANEIGTTNIVLKNNDNIISKKLISIKEKENNEKAK